MTTNLSFN